MLKKQKKYCCTCLGLLLAACGAENEEYIATPIFTNISDISSSDAAIGLSSAQDPVPGLLSSAVEQPGLSSNAVIVTSSATLPVIPATSSESNSALSSGVVATSSASQVPMSSEQVILTPVNYVGGSSVIFSEVSPLNANLKNNDGSDPGWIELFNTSNAPVNLKGIALTDNLQSPRRWVFGNATVPAKGHMVVFLSGTNYPDYIPPSDSVNMVGTDCKANGGGGWGFDWGGMGFGGFGGGMGGGFPGMEQPGGQQQGGNEAVANLPGQSAICFNEGGVNKFGSVMKVTQSFMGGSTSSFTVNASGSANLSKANQLVLKGYLEKGHKLRLNFNLGSGSNSWSGKNLKGTGDSSTVYYVAIPQNTGLNLSNVSGTTFTLETEGSETTTIKMVSYVARNRGHEPNASFKIAKEGGSLYLVNESNGILDSVRYSAVPVGASWSRSEAGAWGFATPSPYGATVGEVSGIQAQLAETSIPPSGFYTQPVSVTLPQGTRCLTGGSEPNINSEIITQTLTISKTTVLRCVTFANGAYPSDMVTRTYVFDKKPSMPALFVTTDPLSMFSPDSGLYTKGSGASAAEPYRGANYWSNRELQVFVELIEPNADKPAFANKVDYKITGQYSRAKEKKSFALTFREEYGEKRLKYPVFPEAPELKKFKALAVRNNGNNFGHDYIRDRLCTSISEGLGVDYQRGRAAIVYYNGEYFGIHNIRERNNEYYYETHYGYDADDIDLIDAGNSALAGSSSDYKTLQNWLNSNSLKSEANYKHVDDQIDVDNYMNYMMTEMFVDNRDWPGNNMKKWRVASEKSKWKWFLYDLDYGFGTKFAEEKAEIDKGNVFAFVTKANGMGWPNGSEHTLLLRRLLEYEPFKNAFINRFCTLLSMNFSTDRLLKRIETLQSEVQSEISRDQQRWELDAAKMASELSTIKSYASTRPEQIRSEMQEHFNLGTTAEMTLASQGSGTILVHNLPLDQPSMKITFFRDVPVTLTAKANAGVFTGWSDGSTEVSRTVTPGQVTSLTAIFR